MNYQKITEITDRDIPYLTEMLTAPEIARYISINEDHYWNYVTKSSYVSYFKAYDQDELVGAVHCEIMNKTLSISILVVPKHQKKGYGTAILKDIQARALPVEFDTIEASVDERNRASIRLFEKMGFVPVSKEDELISYVYKRI